MEWPFLIKSEPRKLESSCLLCIHPEFIIGYKLMRAYSLQKLCWLKRSEEGWMSVTKQPYFTRFRGCANEVPGDNQGCHILPWRSEFASLVWYGKPMPCSQHLHIQFIILWDQSMLGCICQSTPRFRRRSRPCLRFLLTTMTTIQIMMRTKKRCTGPGHLPGSFCLRVEEGHRSEGREGRQ